MTAKTMYEVTSERDHLDDLYRICGLAKLGAASTDTTLNLAHIADAQCHVFETIYELAAHAIEVAERAEKP